ncbi:hypothetical protein PoB_000118700 [Plakobranchus ocellatus]|uniref:Uncharacterized protein n=1 Tax=Plakobranchus ocellatus TaxID=259542 RepID=A0AAV3XX09_9GAST|nr:hypothetical protein PoB_000118700 [Plakobranchus ocellatus]
MASVSWRASLNHRQGHQTRAWLPWRWVTCHVLILVHMQVTCSFLLTLTFALTPTLGAPSDTMVGSLPGNNLSKMASLTIADSNGGQYFSNNNNNSNTSNNTNLTGGQRLFNFYPFPNMANNSNNSTIRSQNGNGNNFSRTKNDFLLDDNTGSAQQNDNKKPPSGAGVKKTVVSQSAHHPVEDDGIPREFPVALVTAASVAAFCILLFFLLAYIWHTRQLDSRARKLAIRLAADAEDGRRALGHSASTCRNCGPNGGRMMSTSSSGRYTLAPPLVRPDSASSSHEQGQYEPLSRTSTSIGGLGGAAEADGDRVIGPDSVSGRSSLGVSESEAGDCEDVFEPASTLPVIPPDRLRGLRSGARGSHRKWSRSRKSGSGSASFEKRDSAVTDKEILTHFASRRHSTFFI